MYDIFKVEHSTYNRERANELVLRVQKLNRLIAKSETCTDSKISEVTNQAQKNITLRIIEIKRVKDSTNLKKIANVKRSENLKATNEVGKIEIKKRILVRKWEKESSDLKFELFNMMSKVVVKNINNYMNLAYNSPVTDECYDRDEMIGESWVILDNCIDKFKAKPKWCFYFYYNKALGRNFYRMFFNTVQRLDKHRKYSSEKINTSETKSRNGNHSLDLLIEQLNLTDQEEVVLRSKLNNEKKAVFLEKNSDFSSGKYYATLKNVKKIILKLRENGEL